MTVYDFLMLSTDTDAKIDIWNFDNNTEIRGITMNEAIARFGDWYVHSFDGFITDNTLCINISKEF